MDDSNSITSTNNKEDKEDIIIQCLLNDDNKDINLWKLRELGLSEGGYMNNALRRRIWPLLVGVTTTVNLEKNDNNSINNNMNNDDDVTVSEKQHEIEEILFVSNSANNNDNNEYEHYPTQLDIDQIDRDVARCSWHLLTGSQRAKRKKLNNVNSGVEILLRKKQKKLGQLIKQTLKSSNCSSTNNNNDYLRYYQGYHDISCIFLTVLGTNTEITSKVLLEISNSHLKDCMGKDFTSLTSIMKLCLFPLLHKFDKQIHDHLIESNITEPYFIISWFITWFAHDIKDTSLVIRIFDAIICSHPLFPLYLCIAMILHPVNRVELLFAECEFSNLHSILLGLPKNSCTQLPDAATTTCTSSSSEYANMIDTDDGASDICGTSQATSTISSLSPNPFVPFEELITRAISYMKYIPPSKLTKLAYNYPYDTSLHQLLEDQSHCITLLQPPPHWLLTPRVSSHWNAQRQQRKLQQNKGIIQQSIPSSKGLVYDTTNAFIAAGYPPKKRFRIRIRTKTIIRFLMILPLLIAIFAFVLRPALDSYYQKQEQQQQSCSNNSPTTNLDSNDVTNAHTSAYDNNKKIKEQYDDDPLDRVKTISAQEEEEEMTQTKFESLYLTNEQSSSHCSVLEEEDNNDENNLHDTKDRLLSSTSTIKLSNKEENILSSSSSTNPSKKSTKDLTKQQTIAKSDNNDVSILKQQNKEEKNKKRFNGLQKLFQSVKKGLENDANVVFM